MKNRMNQLSAFGALALVASAGFAQPLGQPVYTNTVQDAVTGPNEYSEFGSGSLRWNVTPGADVYAAELYERPVAQEFALVDGLYSAKEYYSYLDIQTGRVGFDSQWLYVSMKLFGREKITTDNVRTIEGLRSKYGFRFSLGADGRDGWLFVSDSPEDKNSINTTWGPLGIAGYLDTNGDVGGAASTGPTGLTISKDLNAQEEQGMNGYDTQIVSDGSLNTGLPIIYVRLSPTDNTTLEFALDYIRLGLTSAQIANLGYFDIEAAKDFGVGDMHRNDKFNGAEAGSPNLGLGGSSEFGTVGLQGVYELDNVRMIGRTAPGCRADFDGSGFVDSDDFDAFVRAFEAGDVSADFDGSGFVDTEDFDAFVRAFEAGC